MSVFPDEVLERILSLSLSVSPSPCPQQPTAYRHRTLSTPIHIGLPPQTPRTAPLLVSKTWLRIATPLAYHTLHLHSIPTAALLARTLSTNPSLAIHVRRIVITNVCPDVAAILRECTSVQVLDITLDNSAFGSRDVEEATSPFCNALVGTSNVKKLVIRKPNSVYTSQPKPSRIIAGLANAIRHWKQLSTAHIAFRLAICPTGSALLLADSLSCAPSLRTLLTQLPAVWNPVLLCISMNPTLERIVLNPGACDPSSGDYDYTSWQSELGGGRGSDASTAVVGTGLFLMEARKYPRLSELIRSGTSIIRTRAHTMGTVSVASTVVYPTGSSGAACVDTPFVHQRRFDEVAPDERRWSM